MPTRGPAPRPGSRSVVLDPLGESPMLRMPEICRRTTLSVSTLYGLMGRHQFPVLMHVGPRARGLPAAFLDAWLWSRLEARSSMGWLRDPVEFPLWIPGEVDVPPALCEIRMLRLREVLPRVGLGKSAFYDAIDAGLYPAPAPLTATARRWAAHEITHALRERMERSLREAKRRVQPVFARPSLLAGGSHPPR